ncbi:MAG: cadherin repeat domain-containing protein, partial [Myxococcales bacterium]|nr:cadherin repeat domain-containing protein [Myxococcales bacterium]
LDDPSGAFAVASDGTLRVADGAALDFERTPRVDLVLRALDRAGNLAELALQVTVTDLPQLQLAARHTYRSRGQSLLGGFGAQQLDFPAQSLALQGAGKENTVEFGPLGASSYVGGAVHFEAGGYYTTGHLALDWPVDVEIDVPDQVRAGQVVQLTTRYALRPGARMLADLPFYSIVTRMRLDQLEARAIICLLDGFVPPNVDFRRLPRPADNPFGAPAANCGRLDTGPHTGQVFQRYFIALPTPAREGTASADGRRLSGGPWVQTYIDEAVAWDSYLSIVLQKLGLPVPVLFEAPTGPPGTFANRGLPSSGVVGNRQTFDLAVGRLQTALWAIDVLGSVGREFQVDAVFDGLQGHLTLEDGTTLDFPVGGTVDVALPAGADVNGDGRVDADLEVRLQATVTNTNIWLITMGVRWFAAYLKFIPVTPGAPPVEAGPLIDLGAKLTVPYTEPAVFPVQAPPIRFRLPLQLAP